MDEYTGRFDAVAAVDIRARVNGYLESGLFTDGAIVKKGDPLFVIDPRPYQAALNQAQASLGALQTQYNFAKSDYERYTRLTRTGAAAERDLEQKRQAKTAGGPVETTGGRKGRSRWTPQPIKKKQ